MAVTRRQFLKNAAKIGAAGVIGAGAAALIRSGKDDPAAPTDTSTPTTRSAPATAGAPQATTAPAAATPVTAESLHKEVDEMLGDASTNKFFDNVDPALKKMQDGLKANRDVAESPEFWMRLGMLYGSTGQERPGDWDLTPAQEQDKLMAMGCFNHAYWMDSGINDRHYGPANATVRNAFQAIAGWARQKMGVSKSKAGRYDVKVETDGTLKMFEPSGR